MKHTNKAWISLLILCLLIPMLMLVSCSQGNGEEGSGEEGSGEDTEGTVTEKEGLIYSTDTTLKLIHPGSAPSNFKGLAERLKEKVDKTTFASHTTEVSEHEIVAGKTNRSISSTAYSKLKRMRPEVTMGDLGYTGFLIYSDGSSVAIAYDDDKHSLAAELAVEYFMNNYVLDELVLPKGVIYSRIIDLEEYFEEEDEKYLQSKWNALENKIALESPDNAKEIIEALRGYYGIFDEGLIYWMANLYEPSICVCEGECQNTKYCGGGAFYYSNSARNSPGYLPDVETTKQVMSILSGTGMLHRAGSLTNALPEQMQEDIVRFVKGLQDPDGYFYHYQWGKEIGLSRKGRDLSWSTSLLSTFGSAPTYDTPSGVKGSGILYNGEPVSQKTGLTEPLGGSITTAVSKIIAASETAIPSHMKDEESFRAYLAKKDLTTQSYPIGNEIGSQTAQIKTRDKQLKKEGADYSLMDILIDWLNEYQDPETGHWDRKKPGDDGYSDYYGVNGLMKITGIYNSASAPLPNIENAIQSAIKAITAKEAVGACVDIYNTWFAISILFENLNNCYADNSAELIASVRKQLMDSAPETIAATSAKISVFKKKDGSFSYGPNYSSATSQGVPAAIPGSVEGDVNGTTICTNGTMSLMFTCLGLSDYIIPIYTNLDFQIFLNIIENLQPVMKIYPEEYIASSTEKGNRGGGEYADIALTYEKTDVTALIEKGELALDRSEKLEIDKYYAQDFVTVADVDGNKALVLHKTSSRDDYVFIPTRNEDISGNSYVFESDVCLIEGSANRDDKMILSAYTSSGRDEDNYWYPANWAFILEDGSYFFRAGNKTAPVELGKWYTVRMEIEDCTKTNSAIRYYLNGELIAEAKATNSCSQVTYVMLRFVYNVRNGEAYFDNSILKKMEVDTPPVTPENPDTGGDTASSARGTGLFKDKAIDFSKTATELCESGAITSFVAVDNAESKDYITVVDDGEDKALKLVKRSSTDEYIYFNTVDSGDGAATYVFEADIKFNSGKANRTDKQIVAAYTSKGDGDSAYWYPASWTITLSDGKYYFSVGEENLLITVGAWHNIRVEISDPTKDSAVIKYYLDGELVAEKTANSTAAKLTSMMVRFVWNVTDGEMLFDNCLFTKTAFK